MESEIDSTKQEEHEEKIQGGEKVEDDEQEKDEEFEEIDISEMPHDIETLNAMRKESKHTNIILVCKEKEFQAHSWVLAERCPYFKTVFENQNAEKKRWRLDFSHIEEKTLSFILDFLYSSVEKESSSDNPDDIMDLFETSIVFEINELIDYSWKLVKPNLGYYFDILHTRGMCQENLTYCNDVIDYVEQNLNTIVRHKKFMTIHEEWMSRILKRIVKKEINLEHNIIKRLIQWIKKDEKRMYLAEFLFQLNYKKLSKENMEQLIEDKDYFIDDVFKSFLKEVILPYVSA